MNSNLSPAALVVFNAFYKRRRGDYAQIDSTRYQRPPYQPQSHLYDPTFPTIRVLSEALFVRTYSAEAPFLISGEAFFEDNPLIAASLQPATQQKNAIALHNFSKSSTATDPFSLSIDHRLSIYIQERFLQDARAGQRLEMSHLICMLTIMYPNLKGQLGLARRCISGWKTVKPTQSSAPLTRKLALAFAWNLLNSNRKESTTILMLTFGACLRFSEAQNLTWKQIALPGDIKLATYGKAVARLNVKDAKTWRVTGKLQFVKIEDIKCVNYLRALSNATAEKTGNLVKVSYYQYSRDLQHAAKAFGLGNEPFTSHSARIGKATEEFVTGKTVEQIAIQARWKSLNSLSYYVTNGRAWILNTNTAS